MDGRGIQPVVKVPVMDKMIGEMAGIMAIRSALIMAMC